MSYRDNLEKQIEGLKTKLSVCEYHIEELESVIAEKEEVVRDILIFLCSKLAIEWKINEGFLDDLKKNIVPSEYYRDFMIRNRVDATVDYIIDNINNSK